MGICVAKAHLTCQVTQKQYCELCLSLMATLVTLFLRNERVVVLHTTSTRNNERSKDDVEVICFVSVSALQREGSIKHAKSGTDRRTHRHPSA